MKEYKQKEELIKIAKWWITAFVAILISNYLITQLAIINSLLIILLTSAIISILIQAVRSHNNEYNFKMKWFVFYFLIYAIIILLMREYVLSEMNPTSILSSIIIGFIISGIIIFIQKIGIRSHTIPWIAVILFCILLVANLAYLQNLLQTDLQIGYQNNSIISEDKQNCPIPITVGALSSESEFKSNQQYKITILESLVNSSIWRIEHNFDTCYKGKYQGQYPNWIYCDNLIVSRWETSNSGTINYRWYTAISAEWKPLNIGSNTYIFTGFSCENGQKVTVTKGTTNYYVYDARDGSKIRIAY